MMCFFLHGLFSSHRQVGARRYAEISRDFHTVRIAITRVIPPLLIEIVNFPGLETLYHAVLVPLRTGCWREDTNLQTPSRCPFPSARECRQVMKR